MAKVIITLDRSFGTHPVGDGTADLVALTELELAALVGIAFEGLDCMGGRAPNDLLQDNMSWFNQGDIVSAAGVSTMAARGLMTFLNRKGLISDAEADRKGPLPKNDDGTVRDHWTLSDDGIRAAQHVWATADQLDADMVARRPSLSRLLEVLGH